MDNKVSLFETPVPSTCFLTDAAFYFWKEPLTLRYEYDRDGTTWHSGIRFKRVLATRTRAERCCTAWHIEGTYDTLVEIKGSEWLDELQRDIPARYRGEQETHHYMIYLDSAGCFEVVAASWEVIREERGSWDSTSQN